jgi:hypothetical protein
MAADDAAGMAVSVSAKAAIIAKRIDLLLRE